MNIQKRNTQDNKVAQHNRYYFSTYQQTSLNKLSNQK